MVKSLTCTQEVPGSTLGRNTNYYSDSGLFHPDCAYTVVRPRTGATTISSTSIQCIICYHPNNSIPHSYVLMTALLSKLQKN
jgi:hypothetical protein